MRAPAATVASALLAAGLAGCGSVAHAGPVAHPCGGAKRGAAVRLVLSDVAPAPRVRARRGAAIAVVSRYRGNEMTFPAAHPATAVCEVSRHRTRHGAATVTYKALRPATITFSSTYTHVTQAMMPEMLGRLVVTP